ncbi:hypothetical protein D1872_331400 [compost metagenome]
MAFGQLLKRVHSTAVMVCESNSLRQWVQPGLFLMVMDQKQPVKPGIVHLSEMADAVVPALNQTAFEEVIKKIKMIEGRIVL